MTLNVPNWLCSSPNVRLVKHFLAKEPVFGVWPQWLDKIWVEKFVAAGIRQPFVHQVELAQLAFAGFHCAITTSTASGKTLAYLMPLIAATCPAPVGNSSAGQSGSGTGLYVSPTKALAHDQLKTFTQVFSGLLLAGTLDGDSSESERLFARDFAKIILTNPDMLHYSVLPNHAKWARFLRQLKFVVIDEAHRYRGVWGSHVSLVIRRLRRICHKYGSDPVFILASATVSNVAVSGAKLIGEPSIEVVDNDYCGKAEKTVVFWQPDESIYSDVTKLFAGLCAAGIQTLAFIPSKAMAEQVSYRATKILAADPDSSCPADCIGAYRSGYLPEERRLLERKFSTRKILGLASTNALELGLDINGLDAVLITGFPGTLASFWQQAGRAGRRDSPGLVVFLAADDPLDHYLLEHPDLVFDQSVEATVLDPENPFVLGPHLAAAAQELRLTDEDTRWFSASMPKLCRQLANQKVLRERKTGWYWPHPKRAVDSINLRSSGGVMVDIVDRNTGTVVGEVSFPDADKTVHVGAVYVHQGATYLVNSYSPQTFEATVHLAETGYTTQPLGSLDIEIVKTRLVSDFGEGKISFGDVKVTSQVTGFLRRDAETGEVWDQTELDMPTRSMQTQALWFQISDPGIPSGRVGPALHGMEHCAIGLLPLFATCDRWDIGGLSTGFHPQTLSPTIFIYDGAAGGAGFAHQGFILRETWWEATLNRLTNCSCETGCPACIVSPKCGNANQSLNKLDAKTVLAKVLKT